ncbi:hypothetical protein SD71_04905 [Cohnella kolymensis]|uniref:Uncharacterized protein n=1 Tax=Cohnella kolymensis TaxID=1590652 RepID=A0ABR5A7M3_9BACL|nr:SurA N-terminal domain-containing protein [Cohnella kolymensis]KIL37018.1 hypothetical protein SD71_04905 [Cohnella kolymensis]
MDQYRLDLETKLQQSPIDDSTILSHVDKVVARHEKHLEKSRRPVRFRLGYLTVFVIGLIAIGMTVSPLSDLFHGKTATKAEMPLVEGEGIRIMPEEFLLYKANIEEVNKQPNATPINISDEQIIDNMITDELTVQYAKKLGIVATKEEIDKEIAFQRDALQQSPKDNPIRDIMANRIKRSGLSEDEFWESEMTRRYYEKAILGGKLASKLAKDRIVKIGDGSGCVNFTKELLAKNKDKLTINWSVLQDADTRKDELNNNAKKKASFIERMAHPYENVQFLSGEATIKNDSLSQKFQFSMTRDESNERKFSFVSPGVTGTPSSVYKTTTQTIVAPFSTHAWLAVDVSLWSFAKDESLLGRHVYVVEGKLPAEQTKKNECFQIQAMGG